MKKLYFSMFLLAMLMTGYGQTTNPGTGITYQALIIKPYGQDLPGQNNNNAPLANMPVCLRFSIIDDRSQIEYQETTQVTTDKFGMVNLMIGLGKPVGGYATNFAGINWGNPGKKLRVELDTKGDCGSFVLISEAPFGAVPYALNSGLASIADGSITDAKIQSLDASKITGVVAISQGGTGANTAAGARTNLGLGNVDNTPDINKPVSTPQQNALNLKENAINKQNSLAVDGSGVKFPTVDAVNSGLTLKANQTDLQAVNSNLTQQINNIATVGLDGKEDKVNKQNSLAPDGTGTKYPTVDAINASNALKADKAYVDSQDALKANKTYVDSQDALKADKTYVDSQDALKADKTYVDSQDALKADKTYVDSQDALKADKTYVDSQDALKADITYVDSQDALKANVTYVDSQDALKEDKINKQNDLNVDGTGTKFPTVDAVNTANALKADKTYVDSQDALKEDKVNKQNSLAVDGSGTKFPTVDAVNAANTLKADKSYVDSQDALKANDNMVVHLAGTETITGDKNFIGNTTIANLTLGADPTNDPEAATKRYVDAAVVAATLYKGTFSAASGLDFAGNPIPVAAPANKGYNYICKVAGSNPVVCNVGDHIASNGTSWEVIPASSYILTSQTQESNTLSNLGFAGPTNQQAINTTVNNLMVKVSGDQAISGNKDFTGTLTAATAAPGASTTQVATTAFVNNALNANNSAIIEDAINNDETTKAPTENAVYDALALKEDKSNKTSTVAGNESSVDLYPSVNGITNWVKNSLTTAGALPAKTTNIVAADNILITDSADSHKTKVVTANKLNGLFVDLTSNQSITGTKTFERAVFTGNFYGSGLLVNNSGSGALPAMQLTLNGSALNSVAMQFNNNATGSGSKSIYILNSATSISIPFYYAKTGPGVLAQIDNGGNMIAQSFVKAGGTNQQILLADGTVTPLSTVTDKENTANKQNSLAIDGTGTKFPTVDAVNAANALKADKTYVDSQDALKAPLASPALTGTPTAPTATAGTNTTQIATTAFVNTAVAGATIPDASTTVKGKVQLATLAETQTGTDNTKAVTPADIKPLLDAKAADNMVVHLAGAETITGDKTFSGNNTVNGNTTIANLTLGHDPLNPFEAATKKYVDYAVATNSLYQGTFTANDGKDSHGVVIPAATVSNTGYSYICVTDGNLPVAGCKVGDHIVSNGSAWERIAASSFIMTAQTYESNALPNLGIASGSNQEAINAAVNTAIGNVVKTSGDQAISGNKNFSGTLTAPTAAPGTSTTQIATTAFVTNAISASSTAVLEDAINDNVTTKAPTENAVFDALTLKANQSALAQEITDRTTADALKAPLASPTLTGVPTAPTASTGTNTTQIATTEFVTTAIAGATITDASTTVKGKVRLATDTETQAGLDNTIAVTPAGLKSASDLKEDKANKQNDLTADGSGTKYPTVDAVNAGLTPKEDGINKSTDVTFGAADNTRYPSTLAVKTYVDNSIITGGFELTANKKNDLTADATNTKYPTVTAVNTGLAAKEDTTNKQNSLATDNTNTKYPTVTAVNAGIALKEPVIAAGTTAQYYRGDKTWATLNASVVPDPTAYANIGNVAGDSQATINDRINTKLGTVATDTNVVHITGTETVTGAKTFSSNVSIATAAPATEKLEVNGTVKANNYTSPLQTFSGSAITWDMNNGANARWTLASGPNTLNVTNMKPGMFGAIILINSGSSTMTFSGGVNKVISGGGGLVSLTPSINAIDILCFFYDGTTFWWTIGNNFN